jgi:oxygen-independent coproporphyrinogen-3 oxidase
LAGLYIHIPFCRSKCHYCNFFSLATRKHRGELLSALKMEASMSAGYLPDPRFETIYLGGGTPSVYSPLALDELIAPFSGEAVEITLEINPEDVTVGWIADLKKSRFNRFSLGIQSFRDEDLKFLNRPHSRQQALHTIALLRDAGYENISIDLIFGLPGMDTREWRENLETAFSLGLPHFSAYALTVEEGTALDWMIRHGKTSAISDENQANQFLLLMEMARHQGYEHYEISNFALPDRYSMHNSNYWLGVPYLGLGPSAHSYNGTSRRWNRSSLSEYITAMEQGNPFYEEEFLTVMMQFNEYVMTGLRTSGGCDTGLIGSRFGEELLQYFLRASEPFVDKGLMKKEITGFTLSDQGKLFADKIASEIFYTD